MSVDQTEGKRLDMNWICHLGRPVDIISRQKSRARVVKLRKRPTIRLHICQKVRTSVGQ